MERERNLGLGAAHGADPRPQAAAHRRADRQHGDWVGLGASIAIAASSRVAAALGRRTAAFGLYSAQGNANLSRVPQRLRRVRCGFGLADLPGFAASFSSLIPN